MANLFARMITSVILITGIFWFLRCVKSFTLMQPAQQQLKVISAAATVKTGKFDWLETCASVFPVLLLVFVVRSFIFEPFQIPSGSMMPTLLVGDFIMVAKCSYNIKDPITQTTLLNIGYPKRGDVVVFKYPPDPSINYIKRVVGLPGDLVSYDPINKRVTVQPGCCYKHGGCATALPVTYTEVALSDFVQILKALGGGDRTASSVFLQVPPDSKVAGGINLVQYKESLGCMSHNILTVPGQQDQFMMYYQQPGQPLSEWLVPQGKYFMMGDNRDNSADSRYWGFVPERNLVGKATAIWMSVDKQEGKWPTGLRWSRIGRIN